MQRRLLLSCVALAACSGSPDSGSEHDPGVLQQAGADGPVTYYRDAKPIIEEKCAQCHNPGGMGHFSLETYAEVKPMAPAIRAVVANDIMPPWFAAGPHGQYKGDRRLTDEQKQTLLRWVEQGAQEGRPEDEPPELVKGRRGLPRVDLSLPMQEAYTPIDTDSDDYRCFPLDWQFDQTQYITGLSIEPGDKGLVHHGIVYLVSPEGAARVRQNDAEDPRLGYECMGGPGSWLTSYEPGGYGEENPGGVSFEVRPGSLLVLQMHYNTLSKRAADRSRVDLMLTDKPDRIGAVHLIMNNAWAARRMPIPANEPDVVHKWQGRPGGLVRSGTYDLFWADLHAHTRATSAKMGIVRAGTGEYESLLEIPKWSFEWQETYNFVKPVRLNPYDQLYVECHFDNTAGNQPVVNGVRMPVKDVNWGERTTDEMCLGNVLADRVPDPPLPDGGVAPSSSSSGRSFRLPDGGTFRFPSRSGASADAMDAGVGSEPAAPAPAPEVDPDSYDGMQAEAEAAAAAGETPAE